MKAQMIHGQHKGVPADILDLHNLFEMASNDMQAINTALADRYEFINGNVHVCQDRFLATQASCCFVRFVSGGARTIRCTLSGGYRFESCVSGGWLLKPAGQQQPTYWIPQLPMLRSLDQHGHILKHSTGEITGFNTTQTELILDVKIAVGQNLDCVIWQFPPSESVLVESLEHLMVLETQPIFLWSSHTHYLRPADIYLHLVHGHVYENHEVWPKYWRVCSELDAYSLYVTLSGLLRATGKHFYALLRTQIVYSVIARQSNDGGWYHGEWTDQMESHYRLHAGAMHMLAAYFEETKEPLVRNSLKKAAAFAASRTDHLEAGMWYLHDSLEQNAETMKSYPFRYAPSLALGKSPSNLLVLNTHLDTNIAMERCRLVTGDGHHEELIASARETTRTVLNLRPAEWLYRPLFWAIGLTFLPSDRARILPMPIRAFKRIAWKYVVAQLPRIKALFPRFVMPGGFIERDLAQYGLSVRYQPVNLMDLVRTRRLFDEVGLGALLEESFSFTKNSGIKDRWKENKGKEDDSLGFWAEALYHLCLVRPDIRYRAWLAEAIIDLEDNKLGLPPSLLGANAEAVAPSQQHPCPSPLDARLRLANLSQGEQIELLLVNPSNQTITPVWEIAPDVAMVWQNQGATAPQNVGHLPDIPPRGWIYGIAKSTCICRRNYVETHFT